MAALLGAIGIVGIIVGIVLMIIDKITKKKRHGGFIALVSLVFLVIALIITPDEKSNNEPAKQNENLTWEEKIKEVASKDATETEKFDEISLYANNYKPTKNEIAEFENYLIQEYKNGNYLKDVSNHEYMLENIFKSQVVEQFYDGDEPMKEFAFDFWQNSKYVYRGVDTPDSAAVKSNEEQMDKALAEMGK